MMQKVDTYRNRNMPKYRKRGNTDSSTDRHHCPTIGCLYAIGSERFFSDKKLLNQHIAKVHAEKKYSCIKCDKRFGDDWWRKHHEETCGKEWHCTCGVKYLSRESLLTHARRSQHYLPPHILHTGKKKSNLIVKDKEKPLIVVIQPIIQHLTCIQPMKTSVEFSIVNPRPILPKMPQPVLTRLPLPPPATANDCILMNNTPSVPQSTDNYVFSPVQSAATENCNLHSDANNFHQTLKSSDEVNFNTKSKKFPKAAAETQTSGEHEFLRSLKTCHSQASQCSGRAPKSIRIESTHTQTAESTVVKIKKKNLHSKSKRKSVAITTESNMLTNKNFELEQSLWPGIKDCIFQSGSNTCIKTCSTSTQTYSDITCNKILCDSQTITDDEFLKFNWHTSKHKDMIENSSSFEILSEIVADDSLNLPPVLETSSLPVLNVFSSSSLTFSTENKDYKTKMNVFPAAPLENNLSVETCSIFPTVFNSCTESTPVLTDKTAPPTLSNIHTQTIASSVLDYNLLANMETQTTDDFSFSDLEFSDTETQTPWEDFPNIEDSPLPTDQLSIEIQTDFSFDSGMNHDPYEFLNGMDMQNIISGCTIKESTGVNIETQTYDRLKFPQFTNSESQTLDISQFMFE